MEIKTYRVKRPLKMGQEMRGAGELAPEMNSYLRVDNYVHTGFLAEVWVSNTEFEQAIDKYCPDQAEQLYALADYVPAAKKAAPQIRSNK